MYVRLPDGAFAHLALYQVRGEARVVLAVLVLLEHEGLYLPVLHVARPDDDEIRECGVADPTLLPVKDPIVPVATGRRLQHHGVRTVVGLRKAPGPDLLHPRHLGEPPSFLLLGTTDGHGPHREPGMDPEESIQAPVPARHLDRDEPGGDLAHARTPVLLDRATRYVQGGDFRYELERELGLLPVLVDYRDDLGVSESPNPVPDLTLLLREQLVEQIVVGAQ